MCRIILKYTLFVLGLSFNLKGITQSESIKISINSNVLGNEFDYAILISNSDSVDRLFMNDIDTSIYLASKDFNSLTIPIIYLNPEVTSSPIDIKQSKKFIEIHFFLEEVKDSIIYLDFESSNEKLFNIINIINNLDPNPENNKFQKNILNHFKLINEYNKWLDDFFKCLNIIIDGRIFPDNHVNIHQLEICSNNNDFFTPEWRFWNTNCRDFEWDTAAPQYWNLGFPCYLEKNAMEKLDSLLKSPEFSFLEPTLKNKEQSYINIDFYERGKFLYTKYYNFNPNDPKLFKIVHLIEYLENNNEKYNSVEWFARYFIVEENYLKWKKENKKE